MTVTTGMSPSEFDAEVNQVQLKALLPHLESDIQSLMDGVQTRIFYALRNGSYNIELGDAAWREMFAYQQMFRHYKTRAGLKPQGTK